MVTKAEKDQIADIVRGILAERFDDDEFIFGPIVVEPRTAYDGFEYLRLFIVFEGDRKRLDPGWTLTLPRLMGPALMEMGVDIPISKSFVVKSEWEEFLGEDNESTRLA